jgi:hypothetical protein
MLCYHEKVEPDMTMPRLRIFDVAVVALLLCVYVPFLTVLAQPGASYQAECLIDLNLNPNSNSSLITVLMLSGPKTLFFVICLK